MDLSNKIKDLNFYFTHVYSVKNLILLHIYNNANIMRAHFLV